MQLKNKNMVYVGTREYKYRGMIMSHMASPNTEELHKMADAIGIKIKWFQEDNQSMKSYHPHYDICKSKKELAISKGALHVDDRDLIKICYKSKNTNPVNNLEDGK